MIVNLLRLLAYSFKKLDSCPFGFIILILEKVFNLHGHILLWKISKGRSTKNCQTAYWVIFYLSPIIPFLLHLLDSMSNPMYLGIPNSDKISATPVFMRVFGFCPIITQASILLTMPVAFISIAPFRANLSGLAGRRFPFQNARRPVGFFRLSICRILRVILFFGWED